MIDNDILVVRRAGRPGELEQLYAVRKQVFVDEQQVPLEMEMDAADDTADHFVALFNGKVIGTARLTGEGQIGRLAVLAPWRRRGIGASIMQEVLAFAEQRELKHLFLHAQLGAVEFYRQFGFASSGETFIEAGIPHSHMERSSHAE